MTPRELALLEAHLKQRISASTIQREKRASGQSETLAKRNRLKLIRDFNRNLQAVQLADTPPAPGAADDAKRENDIPEEPAVAATKKRGRKKADYETVQREAQLAADWEQARDAGTYKGDFTRDRGMEVPDLDRLLDRVAARKKPSE